MNEARQRGCFIAVEGIDGAGKSGQSRALVTWLRSLRLDVLHTREPGGSPGAEEIRQLLVTGEAARWDTLSELLLVYAARRSHLTQTIWPALEAGRWVVSDRFADSSRAFQGVAGGLGLEVVEQVHALVVGDFAPDLTIVLDLDPAVALARTVRRGGSEDRFEKKGLAYQTRVHEGFRALALRSPDTHLLIDATPPVEIVSAALLSAVAQWLALRLPKDRLPKDRLPKDSR
ncbi:MAG: dTMP kinase [Pseudomonadales bacterium]|nr:dTMP kinase [Pseudomonadales bacterium]